MLSCQEMTKYSRRPNLGAVPLARVTQSLLREGSKMNRNEWTGLIADRADIDELIGHTLNSLISLGGCASQK